MDLKEIKAIIDLMTRNGLSEFELEKADFKIRVRRSATGEVTYAAPVQLAAPIPVPASTPAPATSATTPPPPAAPETSKIVSPMVGTFYRAPSPDSTSYVEVGTEVREDTVVCIIEAMKVMNEIKAETRGVITEIIAENGKPVEFGRPLFAFRPL